MPNCRSCSVAQSKLNPGSLCRTCFNKKQTDTNDMENVMDDDFWERMDKLFDKKLKEFEIKIKEFIAEEVIKQYQPIQTKVEEFYKIIKNQQTFLEQVANNERKNNLIFTGIIEENSAEEVIKQICQEIAPDLLSDQKLSFNWKRLGNDLAHKPRPLLVELTGPFKSEVKNTILINAKTLKGKENFNKIYINRDIHPTFRKEYKRLYDVVKTERRIPANQGCNIIFDRKNGVVKKDDIIIDTYKPFLFH